MLKKIWQNERRNQKFKYLPKFIEDFSLFIRQCYRINWSVEKIPKKNTAKKSSFS